MATQPQPHRTDEEPVIYEFDDYSNTHLQIHHVKESNGIALAIYEGDGLEGPSLNVSADDAKELLDAILTALNGPVERDDI